MTISSCVKIAGTVEVSAIFTENKDIFYRKKENVAGL